MRLRWLDPDLPQVVESWRHLWSECEDATPFLHPAWSRPGRIVVGEQAGEWVALWPLERRAGCWRVAGTGISDRLDPLARPGFVDKFRELVSGELRTWDWHQQTDTEGWEQAISVAVRLPSSPTEWRARLSKSLVTDLRRAEALQWQRVTGTAFLAPLWDLHRMRWRARGWPGAFWNPAVRKHHLRVHAHSWADDILATYLLRHGDAVVGAMLGLKGPKSVFVYQFGFDPAAGRRSPGSVMIDRLALDAIEDGKLEMDMLRGEEPYKSRWRPDVRRVHARLVHASASREAWIFARHRIERRLRERFEPS